MSENIMFQLQPSLSLQERKTATPEQFLLLLQKKIILKNLNQGSYKFKTFKCNFVQFSTSNILNTSNNVEL